MFNCRRPIVLIDDDEDEIFITSWRLKKVGIANPRIVFTKPDDALAFFEQTTHCEAELPALVLCDMKLPGVRGYELIAAAKRRRCVTSVPLWMLSNSTCPADIAQAEAAGADGYLVKPLSLSAVQTILEGGEPVQDLQCYRFTHTTPPLVRSAHGTMEVAAKDVPDLRRIVDRDLRYVWIENAHRDFAAAAAVGKRDDELITGEEAAELMELKRGVFEHGKHLSLALRFGRSDGWCCYNVTAYPIRRDDGVVTSVITLGVPSSTPDLSVTGAQSAAR